jgi:hypothetical protein
MGKLSKGLVDIPTSQTSLGSSPTCMEKQVPHQTGDTFADGNNDSSPCMLSTWRRKVQGGKEPILVITTSLAGRGKRSQQTRGDNCRGYF